MGLCFWRCRLFPMFLWGVCRGTGKEKKSSVEIPSKAAILLPHSLFKELIKNRGVTKRRSGPLRLKGLVLMLSGRWSCCFISAPRPRWKSQVERGVLRKQTTQWADRGKRSSSIHTCHRLMIALLLKNACFEFQADNLKNCAQLSWISRIVLTSTYI